MRKKGLLLVLLSVIMSVFLCACGDNKTADIDFKNYITLTTEGNDGGGVLKADIDKEKLDTDIKSAMGNDSANTSSFIDGISVEFSESNNLSNGDSVTVTVVYDESIANKMGISFTNTTYTHQIDVLESLETIDPFKNLSIVYEGPAPCAMVKFDYTNDGYLDASCFEVQSVNEDEEAPIFVNVGDRFKVVVKCTDEELSKRGCSVSKTEQEYTVNSSDVTAYTKSVSEIKQETLEDIKSEVTRMLETQFGESLVKATYMGCQMAYLNDANGYAKSVNYTHGFPESANHLDLAYEIIFNSGGYETTWYVAVAVENVINDMSGNQSYKVLEQDYSKGDYSQVTFKGLRTSMDKYSTFFDMSYSVELQ